MQRLWPPILLCLLAAAALLLLKQGSVARTSGSFSQEAYLWQRHWDPPVLHALARHSAHVDRLIVLAAEVSWKQGFPTVALVPIDHQALLRTSRPVGLALRIGHYAGPFRRDGEPIQTLANLARSIVLRAASNRLEVAELQIDFDCAESKLDGYSQWIEIIRERIAPVRLVATALPAWLDQPAFRRLVRITDGYVLQVHSLEKPRSMDDAFTLCSPESARKAVEQAARLGHPFRVALPTYGYLMAFDGQGKFIGLSAEGPARSWPPGVQFREVLSHPKELAGLIRRWNRDRPKAMEGVIWYRLPVDGDRRNWSWATLAEVMKGEEPRPLVRTVARYPQAGLAEIDLINEGSADFTGWQEVRLEWRHRRLVACDALHGFEVRDLEAEGLSLHGPLSGDPLRPGSRRTIGWMRFDQPTEVRLEQSDPGTPKPVQP